MPARKNTGLSPTTPSATSPSSCNVHDRRSPTSGKLEADDAAPDGRYRWLPEEHSHEPVTELMLNIGSLLDEADEYPPSEHLERWINS